MGALCMPARRYNSMFFVPFQLERLLWYGLCVCLDSFLVRNPSSIPQSDDSPHHMRGL